MATEEEGPMVDEIANLLDQCSPDELANILQALDSGGLAEQMLADEKLLAEEVPSRTATSATPLVDTAVSPHQVLPPSSPPPGSRRPAPAGVRKPSGTNEQEEQIPLSDAKKLLDDHSNAVVQEVRRMVPYMGQANSGGEAIDLETLTKVLAARDEEVKELEARLNDIHTELSAKDRRVADLGSELDLAIREVRHRQLDLEFQQLKLEETVRNNAEMEQAAKSLAVRVDEASLTARHAALDVDMGRSMPGLFRAQGSLPWTVRKKRPGSMGITM